MKRVGLLFRQAGIQPLATLERASEVGGVWQVNQYPGCACDVPAHLYSYADEDDVVQWTHFYPSQAGGSQLIKASV